MNVLEIQSKLYEILKPSGWGDKLKMFILSADFTQILTELYAQVQNGQNFTPVLKEVFRPFTECPYSKLRVVFVNKDPYCKPGVADGLAFSSAHKQTEEHDLKYLMREVKRTTKSVDGMTKPPIFDLTPWANQGILLLNTSMTCQISHIGSHTELWKPFITYLFDILNSYNSGIIYVYFGDDSRQWHSSVGVNNYKCFCLQPGRTEYSSQHDWESGDLFNSINNILRKSNNEEIIWQ